MTVKDYLGVVAWLIGVPLVTGLLLVQPRLHRWLLMLLVFTTCYIKKPFYKAIFFHYYRGPDIGFDVTVPDLIFFGYFCYLLLGVTKRKLIWWPYNTTPWVLIILLSLFSLLISMIPLYGLFTIHKFIRVLVFYWVIVNVVREKRDVEAIVTALTMAVLFQGVSVFYDKYITKMWVYRVRGTFPHFNSLSMYLNLIIPILLSLILSNTLSKSQNRWAIMAVLTGIVCVLFTKSRAAIAVMPVILGLMTAVSLLTKPTRYKLRMVMVGLVVVSILGGLATPRLIQRFQEAPAASWLTRENLNRAARAMANDHFFGVGINAFTWMLSNTDYYWYAYPDVRDDYWTDREAFRKSALGQSELGTVHHIYYLFAAEIGWLGMGLFIVFIARFYWRNLWLFFKARDPYYKAILLGMLGSFLTFHLQGMLEWVFRQTQVLYLFFVLSGLLVTIGNLLPRRGTQPVQS